MFEDHLIFFTFLISVKRDFFIIYKCTVRENGNLKKSATLLHVIVLLVPLLVKEDFLKTK